MALRNCLNGNDTLLYWEQCKQMRAEQLQTIDWFSLGQAMRSVPLAHHRWASKQMSGHFSHGKNMVKWKFQNMAQCPRCRHKTEDKTHILCCPQEEATQQWTKAVTALTDWMRSEQSDPQLIQAMCMGLQAWHDNTELPSNPKTPNYQAHLGWDMLLDRWLSLEWRA